MTILYKLFNWPQTVYEFIDWAKKTNSNEVNINLIDFKGPAVEDDCDYSRTYTFQLQSGRMRLNLDKVTYRFGANPAVMEAYSEKALKLSERIQANGLTSKINKLEESYDADEIILDF